MSAQKHWRATTDFLWYISRALIPATLDALASWSCRQVPGHADPPVWPVRTRHPVRSEGIEHVLRSECELQGGPQTLEATQPTAVPEPSAAVGQVSLVSDARPLVDRSSPCYLQSRSWLERRSLLPL